MQKLVWSNSYSEMFQKKLFLDFKETCVAETTVIQVYS